MQICELKYPVFPLKNTALLNILLFAVSFLVFGCEKPNPNPETLDPIYRDLQSRKSSADQEANAARNDLKTARESVDTAVPQTGDIKRARREVQIAEERILQAEQESKYLALLLKERKKWAQQSYMKAFEAKTPWPPPEDFNSYKTARRLREAPRSWDAHLPKLSSQISDSEKQKIADAEAQKAAAAKSGGGGH